MESVLTELYEALAQLRYPEIAKIELEDLSTTVLTGQNRITLLTWLLSHASSTLSTHLEKFQGTNLKDEVVKCYLQMGISNDGNTLLGNCSTKQQILTLRALLLFAKSLDVTKTVPIEDSMVYEVLEKHINETINIIPSSCHVSMKLTDSEAEKYLQEVKADLTDVVCLSPLPPPKIEHSGAEGKISIGTDIEIENGQLVSLSSMAETFGSAFETAEFRSNSKSSDIPTTNTDIIDETIQDLYDNLSSIAQVFQSKQTILATEAPKCLEKWETPLSLLIEDNVIFSEEIRNLYDQCDLKD